MCLKVYPDGSRSEERTRITKYVVSPRAASICAAYPCRDLLSRVPIHQRRRNPTSKYSFQPSGAGPASLTTDHLDGLQKTFISVQSNIQLLCPATGPPIGGDLREVPLLEDPSAREPPELVSDTGQTLESLKTGAVVRVLKLVVGVSAL